MMRAFLLAPLLALVAMNAAALCAEEGTDDSIEADGIRKVESAGGRMRRDDTLPGRPVIEVNLPRRGAADAELLSALESFRHLKTLNLSGWSEITDAGMQDIGALKSLESLNLQRVRLTDSGAVPLAESTSLKRLYLGGTRITTETLARLANMTQLEALGLEGTKISDAGLIHLAKLTGLKQLWLDRTRITDAGLVHLEGLKDLRLLSLQQTQVTVAGVSQLKTGVPELVIQGNVSPVAAEVLPALPPEKELEQSKLIDKIELLRGKVTHDGNLSDGPIVAVEFRSNGRINGGYLHLLQGFPHLKTLDINGVSVTDADLAALEKCQTLSKLSLIETRITDSGLKEIGKLRHLTTLLLGNLPISVGDRRAIEGIKKWIEQCLTTGQVAEGDLRVLRTEKSLVAERLARELKMLEVYSGAGVGERGLQALRDCSLSEIKEGPLTQKGKQALLDLKRTLSQILSPTAFTDAGLKELCGLKELKTLTLEGAGFTDASLEELRGIENLRTLRLNSTGSTKAGIDRLKESLPNVSVVAH